MAIVSGRRQQIHQDLNLTSESEQHEIEKSVRKEEERAQRKLERQLEIEESASYRLIKGIATLMDKYFLDPILGLLPGVGDALGTIFVLPFIYVSLFKIHSIPLTLAVIYNALVDAALGMIPFWIGDILDCFHRANLKSFKLIQGYVEDDEAVIKEVNKKAIFMAFMILVMCLIIYGLYALIVGLLSLF